MELLILSMLFAWGIVRYGATEFVAARSGTEAPRIAERRQRAAHAHEMAMAKLARRTTPTIAEALGERIAARIANPRGGPARQAMNQWWADSWGYALERRRRRHERAEAGDLGRQRAARAAKQWLRNRTSRNQDNPDQQQRVWAEAEVVDDDNDVIDAELVDDDQPNPSPAPEQDTPQPDDQLPTDRFDDPTAPSAPEPDPTQADPVTLPLAGLTAATAELHDIEASLASVTPIRGGMTMTAAQHTMTSGETLDPAAALAFVDGIRDLAQRMFTEIELSVATLSQAGLAGEPIALLRQMQEAAQVLVGNSDAAKSHFERHLATQDVVLSDDTLAGTVSGTYVGTRS
ncbi:hypothetical protein Psed_7008 (plasmid) [Pseudonocardia dioxanivorans CB1190]|uniref:Uncharacterized protein n=1 Tax=Pseudonocardia dioxanivorans (strain ATCC 55486 / DSM 44775 / JCM 13855 / CB1190) TaxID=675635 RepID=F2L792_PSEUX|nr:hypothetical protein [Pseudonocardia dioxanivorans]AEA29065.1 hypothetical protein Psed_7008 [Pseudonocardia dioxanivorans CB1190]